LSPATAGHRPRLLLLNASLAGPEGNSARLLRRMAARLAPHAELVGASLAGPGAQDFAALAPALRAADGFVIATGTHWDGWSSPLQKFLEDATPAEATALWMGKPVAVLVSEHSTGGKGVLSRLQGVLVTLGCVVPPLSGLVISKSAQIAGRAAPAEAEDFWCAADLDVVADNLLLAARQPRAAWRTWPVDRADYARTWVE
jgi:chromate reductase